MTPRPRVRFLDSPLGPTSDTTHGIRDTTQGTRGTTGTTGGLGVIGVVPYRAPGSPFVVLLSSAAAAGL